MSEAIASQVAITGVGLCTSVAEQPIQLYAAVHNNLSATRWHPSLGREDAQGRFQPALTAPNSDLAGFASPGDRALALAATALDNALQTLPAGVSREGLVVLTMLPSLTQCRARSITTPAQVSSLKEVVLDGAELDFRFGDAGRGASYYLATLCHALDTGRLDAVIFGGVDTLVDDSTCEQWLEQDLLKIRGSAYGSIPGEGAAYCVLRAVDAMVEEERPLARVASVAHALEPHAGSPETRRLTALSDCLRQALTAAELEADQIGGFVHATSSTEPAAELEWLQASQALLRVELTEEQQNELMRGHITLEDLPQAPRPPRFKMGGTVGDVGAAAMPMQLALACGRFRAQTPYAGSLVVCETDASGARGAVVLRNPYPASAADTPARLVDPFENITGDPFAPAEQLADGVV